MEKRRLNEIEYMNWTFGQPYNISMAITISGNVNIEKVRSALNKCQIRHPLLEAQLYVKGESTPYFIWPDEMENIQLEVLKRHSKDQKRTIVEKELVMPFEVGKDCRKPLVRGKLLYSEEQSDLIITMFHIISDGFSMVYFFRDFLEFMDAQDERIESLDVVKDIEDILPLSFQKKLPKTTFRFKLLYYGIKLIVKLRRFKNKLFTKQKETRQLIEKNYNDKQLKTITWKLTREETKNLIQKCKKHKVSVHSAICTLFLADFPIINNPVNVRGRLAYDVGEAVGLFASGILIKQKYDEGKSFWTSAKKYNRKLKKKLKGTEVFKIYRSFSRAVSLESIEKLGPLFLELASENKPFAVTNLGSLDKLGINAISEKHNIKELYGGVSGTMDAISVVAFTINEQLHMHFQYYDPSYTLEESKKYVENAKNMLDRALNE